MPHKDEEGLHWVQGVGGGLAGVVIGLAVTGTTGGAALAGAGGLGAGLFLGEKGIDLIDRD